MIFDLPGGLPAMWVALVATLWSGMEYLAKAKSLLS
jgi:CDP-diacylglycerol--glycerol-3-phosphate 3-phosphatidyltransferase